MLNQIIDCYFNQKASCVLECQIQETLSRMTEQDRCIPWYYPQIDQELRLCSPFEALNLRSLIDSLPTNLCQVFSFTLAILCRITSNLFLSAVCLIVMKLGTQEVYQPLLSIDVISSLWD